jgi:hypothetical protein
VRPEQRTPSLRLLAQLETLRRAGSGPLEVATEEVKAGQRQGLLDLMPRIPNLAAQRQCTRQRGLDLGSGISLRGHQNRTQP